MSLFDPREPVSAWSHAAGMIAGAPVVWMLLRRGRDSWRAWSRLQPEFDGDRRYHQGKLVCLAVFGACLTFCYGASTFYHAARLDHEPLARLRRLDHVGIFLMIAGTFTPAAWSLMRPSWRRVGLPLAWGAALACAARVGIGGPFPPWTATLVYMGLGWAMIIAYYDIQRVHGHRPLIGLPLGGVFYTVGAVVNLAHWPILVPGTLGAHELFHLFVLAGTTAHVHFMFRVVLPAVPPAAAPPAPSAVGWKPTPHIGRGRSRPASNRRGVNSAV